MLDSVEFWFNRPRSGKECWVLSNKMSSAQAHALLPGALG